MASSGHTKCGNSLVLYNRTIRKGCSGQSRNIRGCQTLQLAIFTIKKKPHICVKRSVAVWVYAMACVHRVLVCVCEQWESWESGMGDKLLCVHWA